ncbi:DUF2334 domain-containing protein [Paenibacillus sp. HJGM_3]|uniref:DUF2334 domain-containing protein n=1 Tax=Paenibacillus sp. HJGM_3 TaxID=3379816 RepID=UPI00385D86A8
MIDRYIFRFDDIAPNMNWENYFRVKDILVKYNVKPILGVIPDNQDPELKKFPLCAGNFWNEIQSVQDRGWEIALHGYQHKFSTNCAGILGINRFSEFAGVPFDQQLLKLTMGKEILEKNNIEAVAFMAPAHSFDNNTLIALKQIGILKITDGYGLFPYLYKEILFVPQLFASPRKMKYGVYTFCLHLNNMDNDGFEKLEGFLKRYQNHVIKFTEAERLFPSISNIPTGTIIKYSLKLFRTFNKKKYK